METFKTTMEYLAIFVVGIAARAALFVAIVAALVAVLLPFLYAFEGTRRFLRDSIGREILNGMAWRGRRAYTRTHLWVRERGLGLRVGIDDLAARLLHGAERIDLPAPGMHLHQGEAMATITAGHQTVVLRSPVEGMVGRVNRRLLRRPTLAEEAPYGRGWLIEFAPLWAAADTVSAQASREWFANEAARFTHAIAHTADVAAADGGEPLVAERRLLNDEQFAELVTDFLDASVKSTRVNRA